MCYITDKATFATQHALLYRQFCSYDPQLVHALDNATILYVKPQMLCTYDLHDLVDTLSTPLYILLADAAQLHITYTLDSIYVVRGLLAPGAHLYATILHNTVQVEQGHISCVQQQDSYVRMMLVSTQSLQATLHMQLVGFGAQADVACLSLGNRAQESRLYTLQEHVVASTRSAVRVKTVLTDTARFVHEGMLDVALHANGVVACEQSDHMLLSPVARAYVVPAMQVRTDDVQCNHASAIGTIDEQLLWYMQARGIAEQAALYLVLQSFCAQSMQESCVQATFDALLRRYLGIDV